jgi:UDP-hydrolysing UDP-N-acetyl-D-glucosamine 2-epimerase
VSRRHVALVTVGRSDWGIYRSVIQAIARSDRLKLSVFAGGAHLVAELGGDLEALASEALALGAADLVGVESLIPSDVDVDVARSMGLGVTRFGEAFARSRPDVILVLGDRFETFAAAAAAAPLLIPIAHLHGGEVTEGAIDDGFRHAITKLAHLHFVSNEPHGQRVRQLGEEAWRVHVVGAPALDTLLRAPLLSPKEMLERFGLEMEQPFLLCTFHPTTVEPQGLQGELDALLGALRAAALPVVFTMPNADPGSGRIRERLSAFVQESPRDRAVESLGLLGYATLMRRAAVMIGNSSSGLIEAPLFNLPVVNIGARQAGRTRGPNVVDVAADADAIATGIEQALAPSFRARLDGVTPYGDGAASERIVRVLEELPEKARLLRKRFVDLRDAAA